MAASPDSAEVIPSKADGLEEVEIADKDGDAGASGDTRVINQMDIQVPQTFVGLGKEDLLVLANRPFWVRLRWALFISFWLLWLGLLVGAALIIALSPGCENSNDVKSISAGAHHR